MFLYIILRLFNRKREFIEGDELRHMACAKNFYTLWNKSFYDTHPPFYSWLIKCLSWFGYYRAGVIISFLSSVALYIVCGRLFALLGLPPYSQAVALSCLTFNYTLIYYSNKVFRYQTIALLGTSMLYAVLIHNHVLAGLLWGLLGLTCAYAGLRGFWIWLLNPSIESLLLFTMIYGCWIIKKFFIYVDNEYYPSGIDGKIEPVMDSLNFKRLFSPLYFPWTYSYYGKRELGYDFKGWFKKIGGIYGLYQTRYEMLNMLLYCVAGVMLFFTIKGMASAHLPLVLLTIILLYPSLLKRFLPRNSIMAIPLICYFTAKGVGHINPDWLSLGLCGGVAAFICLHRVFLLTQPKIKASVTSRILNRLPEDGVLAEGLIAYPIVFQCNKRVVVIPHDPDPKIAKERVELSLLKFGLNYAVFSDSWKTEEHLGYPAIQYIKDNFNLIKIVYENGERYYVFDLSAHQSA